MTSEFFRLEEFSRAGARKPGVKEGLLANRHGLGDKAAANGSVEQNNSDR